MVQRTFRFLAECKAPKAAPGKVLRQVESESQALAVMLSRAKACAVAAQLEISEGYLSLMRHGERTIPRELVRPLCYATGSLLLQQFIDLQAALVAAQHTETERQVVERLARELAA